MQDHYLGIDIGSISTKGVVVNGDREIVARSYLWTEGNPAQAAKRVLAELDLPNVSVDMYDGLLVNYAKQVGATALVRGLRAVTDFEYEFQMALTNKKLCGDVETIFLTTSSEYMFLSSSIVKQVVHFGGSITDFVPACIYEDIIKKLK